MNLFQVLGINCYSSKREIEEAFLVFCEKLNEREEEIKFKIEHIKDGKEFSESEEIFFNKTIQAHKEMIEKMENAFNEIGMAYEAIMDGSIDDRFDYLLKNQNLYSLMQLRRSASPEEMKDAIQKKVSSCIVRMNSENPDIAESAKNEIGILERFKSVLLDPNRKAEYDKQLAQRRNDNIEKAKEEDKKIIKFIRPLTPSEGYLDSNWSSPMMPPYMPQYQFQNNGEMMQTTPPQTWQSTQNQSLNMQDTRPPLNIDYTYGYHPSQLQNNDYTQRNFAKPEQLQGYVDSNGIFRAVPQMGTPKEYKTPESAGTGEQIHRNKRKVIKDISERATVVPIGENVTLERAQDIKKNAEQARKSEKYVPKHQGKNIKGFSNTKKIAALILTAALIGTAARSCDVIKNNETAQASPTGIHTKINVDSFATAYSILEAGDPIKTALEKAYLDTTGAKNLNYIDEYIEEVERHILSGTATKEHIRFMYNAGLNTTKASIAEGKNIRTSDIILYYNSLQNEANVLIGNKCYNANFYDMENSKLSRQLIENIKTIGNVQDLMNGEAQLTNCLRDLKMQIITVCEDSYNGYVTYGEQKGKLGICVEKSKKKSEMNSFKSKKRNDGIEL